MHNLKAPRGAHQKKRILGRGPSSGHGKTSTRGSKGQTSRAGRHMYAGFEGGQSPLIRRIAKRGFVSRFRKEFQIVNLDALNKIKDTVINPEVLEKSGLIRTRHIPVKILGEGQIKSAVTVQANAFSKSAQEKIKGAGGSFEVLNA
ncbi:MAG: 50S ribosomal protein L15 [Candidatus Omnitrophota bacterium]